MKKIKLKIQEFKLRYFEHIETKSNFEEGSLDLSYRLSFFKKKLKSSVDGQIEKYEKEILLQQTIKANDVLTIQEEVNKEEISDNQILKSKKSNHPKWVKNIYKKIVKLTHPDKHKSERLLEIYTESAESYEKKKYDIILKNADDLMIDLPDNKECIVILNESIVSLAKEIKEIQQRIGYQWYLVPDSLKNDHLKKILTDLGFVFTDNQVEEDIKRKFAKREVGERPHKGVLNRRRKNG